MRALLFALFVLPAAIANAGEKQVPAPFDARPLHIPSQFWQRKDASLPANLPISPELSKQMTSPATAALRIGPIRQQMVNGQPTFFLDGVQVMGGGVSGTMEHGAPVLILEWPSGN